MGYYDEDSYDSTSGGQVMYDDADGSYDSDDVYVVELRVPICCENCEEQIMDHLLEMSGVEGVLCDQNQQKVTVSGSVSPADVLKACKKLFGELGTVARLNRTQDWWRDPFSHYLTPLSSVRFVKDPFFPISATNPVCSVHGVKP